METAQRKEILRRYLGHTRQFEAAAARRPASWPPVAALRPQAEEHRPDPSARELKVLQSVADGFGNREIGVQLFLAEETIKTHVRSLLAKLQARSRAHAVAVGFRRQLIS